MVQWGGGGSGRIFSVISSCEIRFFSKAKYLDSGSFLYDSGRPGGHARFLETPGNSGRLGRSEDVSPLITKATPRKTNQRAKKRSRSMILTDTPVNNDLEVEAANVKRTTGRKVARTLVPKKELKSDKRQKDTEEETCECLVSDEPFGNSRPGT